MHPTRMPWWTWALPLAGGALLAVRFGWGLSTGIVTLAAAALLIPVVFAAVHHAETIAHRVGEPLGTLVLAVAVTVIEAALIVSVMLAETTPASVLARDTVFAAVMIVCNGIVGMCLLLGGARYHEQGFQVQGALSALAVLTAMTVLTLVIPNVTTTVPGPYFSPAQLIFAGLSALLLYAAFLFAQTVRHPEHFLSEEAAAPGDGDVPSARAAYLGAVWLVVALVAVVGIAKALSPALEAGIRAVGAPPATLGIVIAMLVLLPEGTSALRAARANKLQTSLNLALGSSLATIGLTIPLVALVSLVVARPLILGLGPKETALLVLTLFVSVITLGTGRTTALQGTVHLVLFGAFLFLAIVP